MTEKQKVLIVDDNSSNLFAVTRILEDLEVDAITADSGEKAISIASKQDLDLILMDVHMPVMDGFEAIEHIRKEEKNKFIPIVMLTAEYKDDLSKLRGLQVGAIDFIEKPFSIEILISKVKLLLEIQNDRKELVKIKRELEDSEKQKLALLDNSPDLIEYIGLDNKIIWVNKTCLNKFSGAIGKNCLFFDSTSPCSKCDTIEIFQKNILYKNLTRLHTLVVENGVEYWETVSVPLNGNNSKVTGVLRISRDVTEQINMENTLKAVNKKLEEKAKELINTNKYKTEFFSNMSHELRNALNSLLLFSSILKKNKEKNLSAKQLEFLSIIDKNGQYITAIINDILDLSKIEAGKVSVHIKEINIESLLNEIEKQFKYIAIEKNLDFNILSDIPQGFKIYSDKRLILQILLNLISNAFKFTTKGSVNLSVKFPADNNSIECNLIGDETIKFSVIDTGVGIPSDLQQKIFKPFQQVDSNADKTIKGTGLGLSISYKLSKLLKGYIDIESTLGKGSSFSLYIPTQNEDLSLKNKTVKNTDNIKEKTQYIDYDLVKKMSLDIDEESIKRNNSEVVILIDDNTINLYRFATKLERIGFDVIRADSYNFAMDELNSLQNIKFIFIDHLLLSALSLKQIENLKQIIDEKSTKIIILFDTENNNMHKSVNGLDISKYLIRTLDVDRLSIGIKKFI